MSWCRPRARADFAADFVEFLLSDEVARVFRNMTDMSSIPTGVIAYPANTSIAFVSNQPSGLSSLVEGIQLISALEGLVIPWVSIDKLAYSNPAFDSKFTRIIRSVGNDCSVERHLSGSGRFGKRTDGRIMARI